MTTTKIEQDDKTLKDLELNTKSDRQMIDYLIAHRNEWIEDPVLFAKEVLGFGLCDCDSGKPCKLDPIQISMLMDLAKVVKGKEMQMWGAKMSAVWQSYAKKKGVSAQTGKGVGKTTVLAIAAWWFLVCFDYPKIPVLGPKPDQMKARVIGEMTKWLRHAIKIYGEDCLLNSLFEVQTGKIFMKKVSKESRGKEWYLEILSFPKNAPIEVQQAAIQGIHGRYVLFLIDEASGVPDYMHEPIFDTLTKDVNLELVTFNPNKSTGWAINTQTKMKEYYCCNHISAENSPRITKEHVDSVATQYGRDSNKFRIAILGLAPLSNEDDLIPWEKIQAAKDKWDIMEVMEDDVLIYGVDVGGGGDFSNCCKKHGGIVRSNTKKNSVDSTVIGYWVAMGEGMAIHELPEYIAFDMNGIGNGAFHTCKNKLREERIPITVKGVNVKNTAFDSDRFAMLRDELFWRVREDFMNEIIAIDPNDEELEGELSILKFTDEESGGKIKIISKKNPKFIKEMKGKLGYKSPNKADALALCYLRRYDTVLRNKQARKNMKDERHGRAQRRGYPGSMSRTGWMSR